ncbi:MAG: ROK family transcriptional regulator [Actinomycetales bacterium]|nr:ROK family transcriptional regulator [Leifsonia sp.]
MALTRADHEVRTKERSSAASGPGDILQLVRDRAVETRRDVQELTGLSRMTVAQRVDALLSAGLIREGGPRTTGGRRANSLEFDVDHAVLLVAAVDTRHTHAAVTRLDGAVLADTEFAAAVTDGPGAVLRALAETFADLLDSLAMPKERIGAVSISIPGPVDPHTGRPSQPPILPGWDAFPVIERMQEFVDVPVFVENDADAMAFGEQTLNYETSSSLCLVKVSTGIGTGIVINGQIYHGVDGGAGDIGHIRLAGETAICQCGSVGCLAAVASGRAVARALSAMGLTVESGRDVAALMHAGNVHALRLTHEAGTRIGEVLATVVSTLNPGVLLVGGDLASSALIGGIREALYPRSLARATRNLDIRLSTLGADAGIAGLARVAVNTLYAPEAVNRALAG